jgi:ribosomal protein L11 methyltransferase
VTESFLKATVRVGHEQAALLESLLNGQGALAVTLTDHGDTDLWEPGVGETPLWNEVRVSGLFPADTDAANLARVLSLAPGVEEGSVRFDQLAGRNWERAWLDHFRPMRFGQRLWILPGASKCPVGGAVEVRLDPGLAFGTGTHESTRLCLEWIDAHEFRGRTVVDYGCGSGVLGIAAALKGARCVLGVDNDPQAVVAACRNAQRNGVEDRLTAVDRPPEDHPPASVVLANILARILVDLAPILSRLVAAGGQLVLAGLVQEQVAEVRSAYGAHGIELSPEARMNGWVLLCGKRA